MDIKVIRNRPLKNKYRLELSNGSTIVISTETGFKFNIREDSVLSEEKLNDILAENSLSECIKQILSYSVRRAHSSFELKQKLKQKGYSSEIINTAIEKCKEMSIINDEAFAEAFVNELVQKGQGKYKIVDTLKRKGISNDQITKVLDKLNISDSANEEERAKTLASKKMKLLAGKNISDQKLKEKLARYLYSKGFSYDIIAKTINFSVE